MSSYTLSISQIFKAIACHPGPRREQLAAVVQKNLMEIPVVRIPNHAPATQQIRFGPTGAWLTVALVALHDAWAAPENRNELFTPRRAAIDALHYEELAAALRQLGARVP